MIQNQAGDYITAEKKKDLEKELEELKGAKRKEILEALASAKALGDLSENAEYHQAREDQGKLEARIAKIEEVLRTSQVVTGGGGDTIGIGSQVIAKKIDGDLPAPDQSGGQAGEKTYIIVGSEESDMLNGKISNHSPFGAAMFGKKKGDTVSFDTPKGTVNYKIIKVS